QATRYRLCELPRADHPGEQALLRRKADLSTSLPARVAHPKRFAVRVSSSSSLCLSAETSTARFSGRIRSPTRQGRAPGPAQSNLRERNGPDRHCGVWEKTWPASAQNPEINEPAHWCGALG